MRILACVSRQRSASLIEQLSEDLPGLMVKFEGVHFQTELESNDSNPEKHEILLFHSERLTYNADAVYKFLAVRHHTHILFDVEDHPNWTKSTTMGELQKHVGSFVLWKVNGKHFKPNTEQYTPGTIANIRSDHVSVCIF